MNLLKKRKVVLTIVIFFIGIVFLSLGELNKVGAYGGGTPGSSKVGCGGATCHGNSADPNITYSITGIPETYQPEQTYLITIRVAGGPNASSTGNQGGFVLSVTNGTLSVPSGETDIQIINDEATHTTSGAKKRVWVVEWKAPVNGSGDVIFYVAVNSVNGDYIPSDADKWITFITVSRGYLKQPTGGKTVSEMGVPLRAYWLGLIGFAATLIVVFAAYLTIKIGYRRGGR